MWNQLAIWNLIKQNVKGSYVSLNQSGGNSCLQSQGNKIVTQVWYVGKSEIGTSVIEKLFKV